MTIAALIYFIGICLFVNAGLRQYASDIKYKRTGVRPKDKAGIRVILSLVCFAIGTYIMMNLY